MNDIPYDMEYKGAWRSSLGPTAATEPQVCCKSAIGAWPESPFDFRCASASGCWYEGLGARIVDSGLPVGWAGLGWTRATVVNEISQLKG